MSAFLVIIHILVCLLLTIAILMQSSKGGGLAGAFGGQGGGNLGAVFGGRGAGDFLSKLTIVLAIVFMLGSVVQGLVKKSTTPTQSLIQEQIQENPSPASLLQSPDLSTQPTIPVQPDSNN